MAGRRLVELFQELAALDGPSGREAAVAKYAVNFLKKLGLAAQVDNAAGATGSNTGNVVCQVGGGGEFVLLAHMDTARNTAATKQVVTADRITSDGKGQLGADDRAGMAAILYAVERAVNTSSPIKPFTIAFTTQEETSMAGGFNLALGTSVRRGYVFDSSLDPGSYAVASPGAAVFTAEVAGKPSHAGIAPEKGVCAIRIAAAAITALAWGRHDEDTTSNIGTIAGGEATNVVPPKAVVKGEVRSLDITKVEPILSRIKGEFEKAAAAAGGAVKFEWAWDFKPYRHSPDAPVCLAAAAAVKSAGLTPAGVPSHGGSDANSLNAKGIQTVNFGIGARNPHADDEYILLEHLAKASEIVWQLIKK
ncbi:MAG: M20/M25/M40 family metallo-hydrolase [Elusimicrobia bacterium]|nr:M20/M25/M40 family metallo-hydrolase [Elusimicrobiota bacterium]